MTTTAAAAERMHSFSELSFRAKVDDALETVRKLLDTTKHPARAADVPHTYDDKYGLVEQASQAAIVATTNALAVFGVSDAALDAMRGWVNSSGKTASICLLARERCKFLKKVVREEESKTQHVTESSVAKSVTTIEEWIWTLDVEYKLVGFCGGERDKRIVLQGRAGSIEIITTTDKSPRPETRVVDPVYVDITWLLRDANASAFKIDRSAKSCRTPRRNADVEAALNAFEALHSWCARVASYFQSSVFSAQALDKLDMGSINDNGVFVPFVPLMLPPSGADAKSGTLLPAQDQQAFIGEQKRSLDAKLTALGKSFADEKKLVTGAEAMLLSAAAHIQAIAVRYSHCVDYIEFMLEQQLVAAVGKVLQPKDFGEYMQFHARRLFANAYAPKPFVYAIRRPDHCPEGLLTVETDVGDGSLEQPLHSFVSVSNAAASPVFFSLGAATRAALFGERYLHGAILHQFSHQTDASLRLTARARQFSSFVLLAGKIASADTFEPTHAVIVQNKDDVLVPLLLEQIPSAKAFRDAIESLSPEQQRFAKAFRAMQLESTLFGVAVVEIKPQLERLLKLNPDALTKEIRLSQDLMELFIEYQVPSDLLAYDGQDERDVAHKIAEVQRNVAAVQDMIKAAKASEVVDEQQRAEVQRSSTVQPLRLMLADGTVKTVLADFAAPLFKVLESICAKLGVKNFEEFGVQRLSSHVWLSDRRSLIEEGFGAGDTVALKKKFFFSDANIDRSDPIQMHLKQRNKFETAPAATQPAARPSFSDDNDEESSDVVDYDYTQVPAKIDVKLEAIGDDARPTKLLPGAVWHKWCQKSLLAESSKVMLGKDQLRTEKNKAFDLLDALSKSGALPLGNCQLHVLVVVTHCFDRTLMETVTRDNVNPIEKVERTMRAVAEVVHGQSFDDTKNEHRL